MSTPLDFGDEREALAAEYVLGVLDAAERDRARRLLLSDREFAAFVRAWNARLSPLADSVAPVPPPPSLWTRIAATLDDAPETPETPAVIPQQRQTRTWFWQGASMALGALAAGLATFMVLRPAVAPPVQAVLKAADAPVFIATVARDGALLVRAVTAPAVPAGHDLELWVLPAGAQRPASLGVLPAAGKQVPRGVVTAPGTQLLVSLEANGGSPTGQPTGPVLFAGRLGLNDRL